MTDIFQQGSEQGAGAANVAEYSVSEISQSIKRMLEGNFEHVRVRGEVGRPNYHSSGHLYFTLKDSGAAMDAVCWRGTVGRLGLRVEEGMEVVCTGRISSYPRSSKYQIVIDAVELAGEGALLKLLEDRRKKLAAEGLFDAERKKPLPFLPDVIGVVTSPTGAVIRDILHRLEDRFPRHVVIWPVPVQGEGAAEKIAAAIEGFNGLAAGGDAPRPDLIIVARGGGSLEDLWAFNEEVVVRAAAGSDIPLISAVGHETDTTLIDHAADLRAPTPTAAAEMAVPVRAELAAQVLDDSRRAVAAMTRLMAERRTRLEGLARGLPEPQRLLETASQRLDSETDRLANAMDRLLAERKAAVDRLHASLRHPREVLALAARRTEELGARLGREIDTFYSRTALRLEGLGRQLENLSYKNVLARGYAVVRRDDGIPISKAGDAVPGSHVTIEFADGKAGATLDGQPARRGRRKTPGPQDKQGNLL